jgi:hypothetical protein
MVAAALFSAVIVVGAYVLARGVESPDVAQASTETALLQAIATKDSDGDGLPDWEETLYGADPHNPDTFALGMTDGEAVAAGLIVPKAMSDIPSATSSPTVAGADGLPPAPAEGTLTAAFAKSFFTSYLAAKQDAGGGALSESDMKNVSNQAFGSLSSAVAIAPNFKSGKDIKVSGSGADAMKAFAVSAEAVLLKNTADATKTPLGYLKSILEDNDTTAFPHLSSIAKAYRDSAAGLVALPVPEELAADNLALINALMRMGGIVNDFTRADSDPLATILALQQYTGVAQALGTAFINIGNTYSTAGISFHAGTPGASFVNLIADITREQSASKP